MVVCPAHRHNLGIYWRSRKFCQYPGHEGKKIALHCKNPINWQMPQEIREMFFTLVEVGSRKYFQLFCFNYSRLFFIKEVVGHKEMGEKGKLSIRDIHICFVLCK